MSATSAVSPPIHICHVFSSFDPGGPEVRAATLMNLLGPCFEHTIIATNGQYGAADRIDRGVAFRLVEPPPGKGSIFYGLKLLPLLRSLAPRLVTTYNWGAIDAVIASRLAHSWPVIHSEDGFGVDELDALKRRRVLTRRLLLNNAYATLVPSTTLRQIAIEQYRVPPERVVFIRNGVDLSRFRPGRAFEWRRSVGIPDTAVVIGTVGALRAEKNIGLLLDAFADAAPPEACLLIVGDGPCRHDLEAHAERRNITQRTFFVGSIRDTVEYYQAMDVFTLSSLTEQMPIALLEAMACGLPVVATAVGDVPTMLGAAQASALVSPANPAAYSRALATMATDAPLRSRLGAHNRQRAETEYPLPRMVERYQSLYAAAAAGQPLSVAHV